MNKSSKGKRDGQNDTYTPLLNDTDDGHHLEEPEKAIKPRLFHKNPYENSWLISKLFFSWVTPLARVRIKV